MYVCIYELHGYVRAWVGVFSIVDQIFFEQGRMCSSSPPKNHVGLVFLLPLPLVVVVVEVYVIWW